MELFLSELEGEILLGILKEYEKRQLKPHEYLVFRKVVHELENFTGSIKANRFIQAFENR